MKAIESIAIATGTSIPDGWKEKAQERHDRLWDVPEGVAWVDDEQAG